MNQVEMQAGVVRGDETIRYPADEIHLWGVGHGNVQVAEYVSSDREGSPRHTHEWDEIEVVIDGQVEFTVGDAVTPAGPGSVQYLPAGVSHSVRVPEGEARVLMVTIGPSYDGFAREMARLFDAEASLAEIGAEASRYGVTLA